MATRRRAFVPLGSHRLFGTVVGSTVGLAAIGMSAIITSYIQNWFIFGVLMAVGVGMIVGLSWGYIIGENRAASRPYYSNGVSRRAKVIG